MAFCIQRSQMLRLIFTILSLVVVKTRSQEKKYDFIVVGTGAAGGIVLSRLSEDPNIKVLALEAGGTPSEESEIPMLADFNILTALDWNYTTVPQKSCCRMFTDQVALYNRGLSLGGSSSLNFMSYNRGNKNDYDKWRINKWDYKNVLPFFKKFENYKGPYTRRDEEYHGFDGPIDIEVPDFKSPLAQAYMDAVTEIGYYQTDFNAEFQKGVMFAPANTRNHSRCGTYRGYIQPAMGRPNLEVKTFALVTKILFDKKNPKTAAGVEYEMNGKSFKAYATKEVIISGGTINSPQLLMLSGIGPKEHLKEKNIAVVHDLPGVGQNLHDHVDCLVQIPIKANVSMNFQRIMADDDNLRLYQEFRTGPLTVPISNEVTAYVDSKMNPHKDIDWPDLELYFVSDHATRLLIDYLNQDLISVVPPNHEDYFTVTVMLHHPKSRGTLVLKSSDPHDHPIIDPRLLGEKIDRQTIADGIRIVFDLVETEALQRYGAYIPEKMSPYCNSKELQGQEYFECLAETWTLSAWHPVGTCKMGTDKKAVVDSKLRVRGIRNLRVVDASIIPTIVTAHTNAVSMMIGEKGADIIKKFHKIK